VIASRVQSAVAKIWFSLPRRCCWRWSRAACRVAHLHERHALTFGGEVGDDIGVGDGVELR
jgi:hypothetical protein